jgi:hypothetical protein
MYKYLGVETIIYMSFEEEVRQATLRGESIVQWDVPYEFNGVERVFEAQMPESVANATRAYNRAAGLIPDEAEITGNPVFRGYIDAAEAAHR